MPLQSTDRKPSVRTLGFLARGVRAGGRYGVAEAAVGLLKAISDYSNWDRIIVWSETDLPDSIDSQRVEHHGLWTLESDVRNEDITVLHHVGLGPATLAPARGDLPIPIFTSVFPALSYQDQMGQHALEALVRKTTHDTDVYPSSCSRDARLALVGQLEAGGVMANGQTKKLVIPVGVDIDTFAPYSPAEKLKIRAQEGLTETGCIAVILTRFSPSDKADLFPILWACACSPPDHRALQFLLLGSDEYHGSKGYVALLTRYITELGLEDVVSLKVVRERNRTVQLLRCSDMFISPADSVQETFGITPVEAMACGLPAIVSDWNGYRETVIDGVTGFRIPTTFTNNSSIWDGFRLHSDFRKSHLVLSQSVSMDCIEILNVCRSIARSPELRERLGTTARKHAAANFGWRTVISQYDSAWRNVGDVRFATDRDVRVSIDYFGAFQRYATSVFDDQSLHQLSPLGRQVASGEFILPLLADLKEALDIDLLREILVALQETPQSVSSLSDIGPLNQIRFSISWLVKHGFLEATS